MTEHDDAAMGEAGGRGVGEELGSLSPVWCIGRRALVRSTGELGTVCGWRRDPGQVLRSWHHSRPIGRGKSGVPELLVRLDGETVGHALPYQADELEPLTADGYLIVGVSIDSGAMQLGPRRVHVVAPPPSAPVVSSVAVEPWHGHDRVRVWNRGAMAGELLVSAGDGEAIAARLQTAASLETVERAARALEEAARDFRKAIVKLGEVALLARKPDGSPLDSGAFGVTADVIVDLGDAACACDRAAREVRQ